MRFKHLNSAVVYNSVNLPAEISGIQSAYTLIEGQDTVITAVGTDPEGDALTWSFEEVVSGSNYVVVGAQGDDDNGSNSGSVYVYDANDLSAQPTKLTAFDGAENDRFGVSVAVVSDKIVIGAYGEDSYTGSVYVYDANDLSAQPTKLTAFDGAENDLFGVSVAASSGKIVVGAWRDDDNGTYSGSVYVYDANNLSATPTKLTAFDGAAYDYFGMSVAATSDKIFVGAYADDDNGSSSGSVYVYDANNLSATPTKLTAFDGAASDSFGRAIAVTADKIVVGAQGDDDKGSGSGSVYVYDANDLSAQPTKLTAFDGAAGDYFGRAIAVTADKIVVGAYRDNSYAGSVYVFDANDLSATPTKLTAFDGAASDSFGDSVAVVSDKIVVGAYGDDDNGDSSGSVYVYDINDLSAQPTKLTDGAASDSFGRSVAAISSPSQLNGVTVSQSDNVFTITPASTDANFTLRFKVTDEEGNVTTKTSTFSYDYVNKAPVVTGIVSNYNLTQGQDTVITATGTDPEGDAITWSFEEALGSGVFVRDNNDTYLYNPSTMELMETIQDPLAMMTVGGGKLAGKHGNSIKIYDLNDLSASPFEIGYQSDADSIALSENYLIVGNSMKGPNFRGEIHIHDLNNLDFYGDNKTVILSPRLRQEFGMSVVVTNNKLVCGQSNAPNESYGLVIIYDLDDLSASPTVLNAAATLQDCSIAAFGTHFVVGIPYAYNGSQQNSGAAYIYDTENLSAAPISVPLLASRSAKFGTSVALSSDYVIVQKDSDKSVYVFDRNNLSANPAIIYKPSNTGYYFGQDLAVSGDRLFVGDKSENNNTGKLYVYDFADLSSGTYLYNGQGTSNQISGSNTYVSFSDNMVGYVSSSALNGVTVTQSDNVFTVTPGTQDASFTLNIKATDSNGNTTTVPATFAFNYQNQAPVVTGIQSAYTLTQGQDTVITAAATDPEGDAITWSFEEVIGSGDGYVAVSSYNDDDTGTNTGAVYIYNTNDLSAQPVKLVSTESTDNGRMGETDVVFGAGKVIVGARRDAGSTGAVYIYDLSDLSAAPTRLAGPSSEGRFGNSVAVHSTNLIVGASWDNSVRSRSGRVYIYDLNDLSASPTTMIPDGVREYAYYGSSVTISGDLLFISSPYADSNGAAVYVYNANDFSLIQKLSSPSPQSGDNFGGDNESPNAISVSGNNLIIGSSGRNSYKGSVYVFALDDLSATPTELMPYDGSANGRFGACVASTSEYIIVGSYGHSAIAFNGGAVYIYDINDLSAQPTKINTPVSTQYYSFGKTLSAIEDRIFVGAPNYDTHVYNTSDFSLIQTLPKPADVASNDGFAQTVVAHTMPPVSALNGVTVSQSDNVFTVTPGTQDATFTLNIKATDSNGNVTTVPATFALDYQNQAPVVTGIQSAYTLTQGQDTVITATGTDPEGDAITWSYEEVLEAGSRYVIVGAFNDDDNGENSGSVYVYDANNLSATPTKLTAFDAAAGDNFGISIATAADKIVVGAYGDKDQGNNTGAVYVYDVNNLSATPTKLTAFDAAAGDYFGQSVAATADKIFVGVSYDDDNGSSSGSVYVYDANDLSAQPTKLTAFDGDGGDIFGGKLAVSGDKLIVSAQQDETDNNIVGSGSVYVYDINNLSATPTKLTAFDAADNDYFGSFISATADKIVVGAYYDDENGNTNSGSVYVFDANDLSAQPTKLTAFDGAANAQFGWSIAATSDKIFVGARGDDSNTGSVYVYDANNLSAQPTKLTAFDGAANDYFGQSIATIDDKIIVSAYGDNSFTGSVYVYDANDLSATPTKLTAFDAAAADFFGVSVVGISLPPVSALNGVTVTQSDNTFTVTPGSEATSFSMRFTATDANGNATTTTSAFTVEAAPAQVGAKWVIVSATGDNSYAGSVYVYDANNLSATPTKLTAFDGAASDYFGDSVTATNDKIIVSARQDDDKGSNSGSVYVYDANDLSAQPTKLTAFDGAANDYFGSLVSATADKIIVSATGDEYSTGSVYVYDTNNLSATPTKLTAFDGAANDHFGQSVVVTGDKIAIGAPSDDDNGSASGSVYVYDINDLSAQPTKLTAFDGAADDKFGDSVTATNDKIIVGAWRDDDNGTQSGSVYVYDANNLSATPTKLTAFDGAANDHFGYRVAATGDKIVVSAWGDDSNIGSVYVYDANDLSATPTKLVAFDGAANDYAGYSIAAGFDTIVVGAFADDDNGSDSGSVYVYDANNLSAQPTKLTAFDGAANYYFSMGHMPIAIG